MRINTFTQITLFPDHDRLRISSPPRAKKLPIEKALSLFPRHEKQFTFGEFFDDFARIDNNHLVLADTGNGA